MKKIYIIAGCNGAGKTTASYTILPEMLDCHEFVNADEIAKGLSPFQPEKAALQAGRLMLTRIKYLMSKGEDFAFETTLATRSYVSLLREAHELGYVSTLLFFWLNSPELAVRRVQIRVQEGGHHIPEDVIRRRYERGLHNFFTLFKPLIFNWILIDNSENNLNLIAESTENDLLIHNENIWNNLILKYDNE